MINTKLNLFTSGTIDLYEDVPIPLNYSIAEVQSIDKTNSAFSKTITIPGTKNNNKLLGHLFNIGVDNTYNVNVKAPCNIEVDTLEVIRGHLRLANIRRIQDDQVEYDVEVQGPVTSMFNLISDAKLTDLDFSTFDLLFTSAVVQASWTQQIYISGVLTASSLGIGYVFDFIDKGMDSTHKIYHWHKSRPAIYVKQYIDKIFELAGFTYTCDFFETDFFKRLTIPSNTDSWTLTEAQLAARRFRASVTQYTQLTSASLQTIHIDDDTTSPNTDPSGQWNTATYLGTAGVTGTYTLQGYLTFDFSVFTPGPSGGGYAVEIVAVKNITYNGSPQQIYEESMGLIVAGSSEVTVPIWNAGFYAAGDTVQIKYRILGTNISAYPTIRFKAASYIDFGATPNVLAQGQTISINSSVPQDILCRDLFTSIIKMFNLYVDVDKQASNNLLISPRNDFYEDGITIDWSDKLDRNNPLQITPANTGIKEYGFKYKEDKDFWNEKYKGQYAREYADRTLTVNTDFMKDKQLTEVIFSPTPSVQFLNSDRVVPAIYHVDKNGAAVQKPCNIRILYFGGMKACAPAFYIDGLDDGTPFGNSFSEYPFFGMVDDPTNPTVSLDWGVPREIYWETLLYTNNGLVNRFYKQFLEETFNPGSRLVSGKFYLNPADINGLDFRNTIHIDGINYRLNKVVDYDPVIANTTVVELIKITHTQVFEAYSGDIEGAGGVPFFSEELQGPIIATEVKPVKQRSDTIGADGNSYYPEMGQRVSGQGNFITPGATFAEVSGQMNRIGDSSYVNVVNSSGCIVMGGCKNISLINSSGVIVSGGLTGVHVVNSGPTTITESNIVYIGNNVFRASDLFRRSYAANFIQTGTDDPVQTEFINTLGFSGQFIRTGPGVYELDLGAVIPTSNIFCDSTVLKIISSPLIDDFVFKIEYDTSVNTVIIITTFIGASLTPTDNALNNTSIEFHIFE